MKTFHEWWMNAFSAEQAPPLAIQLAWNEATLAERERCAKVCARLDLKMSLRGDCSLVEGWERFREEVLNAIRNP